MVAARSRVSYEPGYVIAGKYELEAVLGEGGMGTVWRARNTSLESLVALKVVRSGGDRDALGGRLIQEARAAAKLSHPAIVRVLDVGQTESGDPFIVMELLNGSSLAALLASERRFSAVQAVQVLLPIADGLSMAHGKGIVHRDIKPDNIFLVESENGVQPKLVDFGIVKVQQDAGPSQVTQSGTVLGSPDYMSPEQARGLDDVDARTDVWSFSVVLYETITGRTPFKGSNYNALLRQIVEDTPTSLLQLAAADLELSAIVAKGLSKDRGERFGSMDEMGKALATWIVGQGVGEDVCGTALESKWLNRGPELRVHASRASMVSFTDGWPEPGSGVRPGLLADVNTIPAPVDPDEALAPPLLVPPAKRAKSRLYLGVAAVAAFGIALPVLLTSGVWGPAPLPGNDPSTEAESSAQQGSTLLAAPSAAPNADPMLQPAAPPSASLTPRASGPIDISPQTTPVQVTSGATPTAITPRSGSRRSTLRPVQPAPRPNVDSTKPKAPAELMTPYQ